MCNRTVCLAFAPQVQKEVKKPAKRVAAKILRAA